MEITTEENITHYKFRCKYCNKIIPENKITFNKKFCDYDCSGKYNTLKCKIRSAMRVKYYEDYRKEIEKDVKRELKKSIKKLQKE